MHAPSLSRGGEHHHDVLLAAGCEFLGYFTAGLGYTSHTTSPLVSVPYSSVSDDAVTSLRVDDLFISRADDAADAAAGESSRSSFKAGVAYAGVDTDELFASSCVAPFLSRFFRLFHRRFLTAVPRASRWFYVSLFTAPVSPPSGANAPLHPTPHTLRAAAEQEEI